MDIQTVSVFVLCNSKKDISNQKPKYKREQVEFTDAFVILKINTNKGIIRRAKMANKRYELNKELAQMLKGGVIMDVTTPEQAKIAEEAGACAVMALERIPADIRAAGGVARMSDPAMIKGIQEAVKCGTEIMAVVNEKIVAVKYNNMLAMSFHPELNESDKIHKYFVDMIINNK